MVWASGSSKPIFSGRAQRGLVTNAHLRLCHDTLFPPSPADLFFRHSQVFTHGMMLLWGVTCDSCGCWNRGMVHFTGFSFLEFKDIHDVNLSVSTRTPLQQCCHAELHLEHLCDSSPLACSVALPWANHYISISSLTPQNTWHRPQRKAIISINLLSCLPSEGISLVG